MPIHRNFPFEMSRDFSLVAIVSCLVLSLSFVFLALFSSGPASAQGARLTSNCSAGETVCWVDPKVKQPVQEPSVEVVELGSSANVAGVRSETLSLSAADLGATRETLSHRIDPLLAEQKNSASETDAIESNGQAGLSEEVWISIPDVPTASSAVSAAAETSGGASCRPIAFEDCVERSVRGGATLSASMTTCRSVLDFLEFLTLGICETGSAE